MLQVVGFSGTIDNRALLPLHVGVQDTKDPSIRGTDGRMISTLLLPDKCNFENISEHACNAQYSEGHVSMHVLQFAVDHGVHAVIDAGMPFICDDFFWLLLSQLHPIDCHGCLNCL